MLAPTKYYLQNPRAAKRLLHRSGVILHYATILSPPKKKGQKAL
jgi:hypothetical protein